MTRVKRGTIVKKRHKRLLKKAKGFRHGRKRLFRQAKEALLKAEKYRYRDRRTKKREKRKLWIVKINAAARELGLSYSQFMGKLKKQNIELNRKVLSELAEKNPEEFQKILEREQKQIKALKKTIHQSQNFSKRDSEKPKE